MKQYLVIGLMVLSPISTLAQDSLNYLSESVITHIVSRKVEPTDVDSNVLLTMRAGNLYTFLDQVGSFANRANAAGGLSTFSYRGFDPSQNRVVWNGIPISNPMNSQIDLALIPSFFTDRIDLSWSQPEAGTEHTGGQ